MKLLETLSSLFKRNPERPHNGKVVDITTQRVHRDGRYSFTIPAEVMAEIQKQSGERDLLKATRRVLTTGLTIHTCINDPDKEVSIKNLSTDVTEILV